MNDRDGRKHLYTQKEKLLDTSENVEVSLDPITQYNHVLTCYNTDENRVGQIELQKMSEYGLYKSFWKLFNNPCALMFYLLLIMVPFVGGFLYLIFLIFTIQYFINLGVFNKNRNRCPEPFQNMIFCPELCAAAGAINKFYQIKTGELQGFSFNSEVMQTLKLKEYQGYISFMVYNNRLWDYYHNYSKIKGKHILSILLGTGLLAMQFYTVNMLMKNFGSDDSNADNAAAKAAAASLF
mmetsp:Transcript_4525/g.3740  ORF Transcript_4525/g.3740 Transcript_4525/m.3740 type:complete len:238 (-) Transcript_4525:175-888(-)